MADSDDLSSTPPSPVQNAAHLQDHGVFARGGFGGVHRVFDTTLRRDVAMKVLEKETERAKRRFLDERQIASQLEHPNIVPVYEAGTHHDMPFFTMKMVKGQTLTEVLRSADLQGDLRGEMHRLLQIFMKVCDAVAFAHAKGVLHRDLKPSNVMVGSFGQVYLLDWGVALATGQAQDDLVPVQTQAAREKKGSIVGTAAYMSPEQAQGKTDSLDERSDTFSLGGLLYFLLTGTAPYRGHSAKEKLLKARKGGVAPPELRAPHRQVPPPLSQITMRALAVVPGARYPSASALRADVERFLQGAWFFETRAFTEGDIILTEGDAATEAFLIQSGTAEAFRLLPGNVTERLGQMNPGDVFGETAIFTNRPRTASVRATAPMTALVLTAQTIRQELGTGSWMNQLVSSLAARFVALDERVRAVDAPIYSRREERANPPKVPNGGDDVLELGAIGQQLGDVCAADIATSVQELLLAGEVNAAADCYVDADRPEVGALLLATLTGSGEELLLNLAQMFTIARDYHQAAQAYLRHGDEVNAAQLLERAGAFGQAGAHFEQAGQMLLAGHAYLRGGLRQNALLAFEKAGEEAEQARVLLAMGQAQKAALLFAKAGDVQSECTALRQVPMDAPERVTCTLRLASVLSAGGDERAAASVLYDTLVSCPQARLNHLIPTALADALGTLGDEAGQQRTREWCDRHALTPNLFTVPSAANLAETVLSEGPPSEERSRTLVQSNAAFARLDTLPLFGPLSRADLRALHLIAEQRRFAPGEFLLRQNVSSLGLFVLVDGDVDVSIEDDTERRIINHGSAGMVLGEISLLCESVATATVTARSEVTVILLPKTAFVRFLQSRAAAALEIYKGFAKGLALQISEASTLTR